MAVLCEGDRILPAGTLVHIHGMPVRLGINAMFSTHPGNWKVIDEFSSQTDVDESPTTLHGASLQAQARRDADHPPVACGRL